MSLERRPPKPSDQEKVSEAIELIYELIALNQQIEPSFWCGAIVSVLIMGYKNAGYSLEKIKNEINEIIDHYEELWEDED